MLEPDKGASFSQQLDMDEGLFEIQNLQQQNSKVLIADNSKHDTIWSWKSKMSKSQSVTKIVETYQQRVSQMVQKVLGRSTVALCGSLLKTYCGIYLLTLATCTTTGENTYYIVRNTDSKIRLPSGKPNTGNNIKCFYYEGREVDLYVSVIRN